MLFALIVAALIVSLSFHEFGHAAVARSFGDDTAQRAGRLTLNPVAHIDPLGLAMVLFVGFGYARPVPTDPRKFRSVWGDLWVAAAGPGMNLLLAMLTINVYLLGLRLGYTPFSDTAAQTFVFYLVHINLLLMLFNLIPVGPLDGHYIAPYLLPRALALRYRYYNARYGHFVLLGLIALSLLGVPVFRTLLGLTETILPWITFL